MASITDVTDLTGKLLIASPGMRDARFSGSVVFICAYGDDGAMGLVINRPAPDIDLGNLLRQLDIPKIDAAHELPVHFGGPVEPGRGFVLHSPDYITHEATLRIDDAFCMTASLEVLEALGQGSGPSKALLALGYSGWAPGQLEREIADNGWLVAGASPKLVFANAPQTIWANALETIGASPSSLSAVGGRA